MKTPTYIMQLIDELGKARDLERTRLSLHERRSLAGRINEIKADLNMAMDAWNPKRA